MAARDAYNGHSQYSSLEELKQAVMETREKFVYLHCLK